MADNLINQGLKMMLLGHVEDRDKRMAAIIGLPHDKALKALKEEMGYYGGASLSGGWVTYFPGKLEVQDKDFNLVKKFSIPELLEEAKRLLSGQLTIFDL